MTRAETHRRSLFATLVGGFLVFAPAARAAHITLTEENDALISGNRDRHYTQGLRASYLSDPIASPFWNKPFDLMASRFGILEGNARGAQRRIEWTVLGQSLFTPTNIHVTNPDLSDRPYAGWLYTGAAFLQDHKTERGSELENFEVLLGVIGPAALGRQTQNDFHTLIKVRPALGWAQQLPNEPGVVVTYERKWRYHAQALGPVGFDIIPTAGASVGNVFTYAQAGATFRIGRNLDADYGPAQVRPEISGTAWFDDEVAKGRVGWSLFVGVQGRAVARNLFLDGSSFAASRSVAKNVLVMDVSAGVSGWISNAIKLDFTVVERSPEFKTQKGWDRYGLLSLSFAFW